MQQQGVQLVSRMFGGEQERKRRAGTENIASIVGFEEAVLLTQYTMEEKQQLYISM